MNSNYHLNEKYNAEAKYRTNSAAAGEAGLLRNVSAGRAGAETSAAAPKQRDACLPRNDGGTHGARRTGEGEQPRHEPPTAPTVRQPMGGVDDSARAQAGHLECELHPVPHPIRAGTTVTNQIS